MADAYGALHALNTADAQGALRVPVTADAQVALREPGVVWGVVIAHFPRPDVSSPWA